MLQFRGTCNRPRAVLWCRLRRTGIPFDAQRPGLGRQGRWSVPARLVERHWRDKGMQAIPARSRIVFAGEQISDGLPDCLVGGCWTFPEPCCRRRRYLQALWASCPSIRLRCQLVRCFLARSLFRVEAGTSSTVHAGT